MTEKYGYLYITHEDPTCIVRCLCMEEIFINDYEVKRCPKCNTGFKTEFLIHTFSPEDKSK